MIVATVLRREGHMVDVASSGLEALEKIASNAYDLVFLDIFMPGIDGLETVRRIRTMPGRASTMPVVALTANVSGLDRADYLAAGMDEPCAQTGGTGVAACGPGAACLGRPPRRPGSPAPAGGAAPSRPDPPSGRDRPGQDGGVAQRAADQGVRRPFRRLHPAAAGHAAGTASGLARQKQTRPEAGDAIR